MKKELCYNFFSIYSVVVLQCNEMGYWEELRKKNIMESKWSSSIFKTALAGKKTIIRWMMIRVWMFC